MQQQLNPHHGLELHVTAELDTIPAPYKLAHVASAIADVLDLECRLHVEVFEKKRHITINAKKEQNNAHKQP